MGSWVGWNAFTDCSTISLKAFALRPYFAANHGGHLISCSVPRSVYLWLRALKVLVVLGDHTWLLLTISVLRTPPSNRTTAVLKAMVRQNVFTAILYIVLLILSVLYFNFGDWFTHLIKGILLLHVHLIRPGWGPKYSQCVFFLGYHRLNVGFDNSISSHSTTVCFWQSS